MLVEADADAAVQLLEFEMTQERLGMGPAEGCVGGRTWLCHVDAHVVSLALDSTAKVSSLAVPQLAPCAALARAWRLWAARHSQSEAQATGRPGHRLRCSSELPPKSPISLRLTV